MGKLFDKVQGTSTAFNAEGITDSAATWVKDYFVDWWVVINGTEYQITSNTETTLSFSNTLAANADYSIEFVTREFLKQIDDDAADTAKITDQLILNKYNQANIEIHNKVFAYLRSLYSESFDPLQNIFNLTALQPAYAYFILGRVFQDLMIDQESFQAFKGYDMYEKSYNASIKDGLALLQIDLNKDGEANATEKQSSVSSTLFLRR